MTEEEIKAIIQEGTEDGEIQEVEQDIVEKVFNLGDRKIGSIMTHRSDLIWLEIGESAESIRNKVKENVYTVYPVAHDELDHIEGVPERPFQPFGRTGFQAGRYFTSGSVFPGKPKRVQYAGTSEIRSHQIRIGNRRIR